MIYRGVCEIKKEYDVIIIGSGLGGLTCANVLAKKFGYKVAILEQHSQIGGLAAYFKRKYHIFDVSLHGFPYGMIKTCRRYWSKEIADSIIQLKEIRFDNPQFSFTTTFDKKDFIDKLVNYFKIKESTVNDFFNTVEKMDYFDKNPMTTGELFDKFFKNRNDIVRLLMEPITYANGSDLDDPAITYGIVFSNFMNKGVFTFQGGTDELMKKMSNELVKNGVDIAVSARVSKILVENSAVMGVVVDKKEILAKSVVSNANLLTTINKLVGKEHFSGEFLEEVSKVKLNNSSCQVYIGIKKGETIDNIGDLIFTSDESEFSASKLKDMDTKSRTFSIYYPVIRPHLNQYSIVASQNANYDDWVILSKEEYKKAKEKLCEVIINHLERYIKDIRKKIDYYEAATPLTFKRYTLHEKGASFGTKFEGLSISMNLNFYIKGLYHTGSVGIIMSGWLGAANYGVIVANNVDRNLCN